MNLKNPEHQWMDFEQIGFRAKNSVICELITLPRANQIARISSEFKLDVINAFAMIQIIVVACKII